MKAESLETKFDNLKLEFTSLHNFGRERAAILERASSRINFDKYNCTGSATRHAFYLNGKVGQFFAPHFICSTGFEENLPEDISNGIITHPYYDVGIILQCPVSKSAVNISSYTVAKLGDDVISYGFGDIAESWKGSISSEGYTSSEHELYKSHHWSGSANIGSGEVIIQAFQQEGMSGAAVSNGCGYLGMSHAVRVGSFASFASIIPAEILGIFAIDHWSKLINLEDCLGLEISNLPTMPLMDCDIRLFKAHDSNQPTC